VTGLLVDDVWKHIVFSSSRTKMCKKKILTPNGVNHYIVLMSVTSYPVMWHHIPEESRYLSFVAGI
jgi:hypothetical protein